MCKIRYKMVCFSESLLWLYRKLSVYETKLILLQFRIYETTESVMVAYTHKYAKV